MSSATTSTTSASGFAIRGTPVVSTNARLCSTITCGGHPRSDYSGGERRVGAGASTGRGRIAASEVLHTWAPGTTEWAWDALYTPACGPPEGYNNRGGGSGAV